MLKLTLKLGRFSNRVDRIAKKKGIPHELEYFSNPENIKIQLEN